MTLISARRGSVRRSYTEPTTTVYTIGYILQYILHMTAWARFSRAGTNASETYGSLPGMLAPPARREACRVVTLRYTAASAAVLGQRTGISQGRV
jgi:hypothetical protein